MKEAQLTWSNFWKYPRFWRHFFAWVVLYFITGINTTNKTPPESNLIMEIAVMACMVTVTYLSFYWHSRYYLRKKKWLFFILNALSICGTISLLRLLGFLINVPYEIEIWEELIGVPLILVLIYIARFGYRSLRYSWEINRLNKEHLQTTVGLEKLNFSSQDLIFQLAHIKETNLKDVEQANEAILALADTLRTKLSKNSSNTANEKVFLHSPIVSTPPSSKKLDYNRIKRHVIVWTLMTFLIWFLIPIIRNGVGTSDWLLNLLKATMSSVVIAGLIYTSLFLYERFFIVKKYGLFFITQTILILLYPILLIILRYLYYGTWYSKGYGVLAVALTTFLLIAYGVKIAYHFLNKKADLQILETTQKETELKLLKAQINPHFLFNMLNNIYGKNLVDSQKANEYLEGLIALLKYQNQRQQQPFISLNEEVQIVKDYITLEEARHHNCEVEVNEQGDFTKHKIIPLLLLPLIENAFKYGSGTTAGKIRIAFQQIEKQFHFSCQNRILPNQKSRHSTGIGLDNVQKRLNLIYPNKHQFQIEKNQQTFTAKLTISF